MRHALLAFRVENEQLLVSGCLFSCVQMCGGCAARLAPASRERETKFKIILSRPLQHQLRLRGQEVRGWLPFISYWLILRARRLRARACVLADSTLGDLER